MIICQDQIHFSLTGTRDLDINFDVAHAATNNRYAVGKKYEAS